MTQSCTTFNRIFIISIMLCDQFHSMNDLFLFCDKATFSKTNDTFVSSCNSMRGFFKRQTCDLCIPRICRTVIQNFKMYVRVQDIEIPDRLKQITVKSRFSCTDIDGSVFQADQVTEIVFSLKKLSTSGSYIFIKNISVSASFRFCCV